jgi:acyl carrier protein
MQINTVIQKIRAFIAEHFPMARNISNDSYLLGGDLVDSLGILEVVAFLEQEFQIAVTDEELLPENFQSIIALAAFIHGKLSGALTHQL